MRPEVNRTVCFRGPSGSAGDREGQRAIQLMERDYNDSVVTALSFSRRVCHLIRGGAPARPRCGGSAKRACGSSAMRRSRSKDHDRQPAPKASAERICPRKKEDQHRVAHHHESGPDGSLHEGAIAWHAREEAQRPLAVGHNNAGDRQHGGVECASVRWPWQAVALKQMQRGELCGRDLEVGKGRANAIRTFEEATLRFPCRKPPSQVVGVGPHPHAPVWYMTRHACSASQR